MRIEVDLTPEDYLTFSRFAMQQGGGSRTLLSGGLLRTVVALTVVGLLFGIALSFVSGSAARSLHIATALVIFGVFLALLGFGLLRARNAAAAAVAPKGRYTYTISPEGIHEQSANIESMMRWSAVR